MFWFFKKKKSETPSASPQTLGDIARGMQHAVNTTQEIQERHFIEVLDRFFDSEGRPHTARFHMPNGTVLDVPLISLINPNGLMLKEMEVEMSVRIDHQQVKPHDEKGIVTRTSFQCSFSPRKHKDRPEGENIMTVKMKFVAGDPPEGVARIVEQFANEVNIKNAKPPSAPKPGAAIKLDANVVDKLSDTSKPSETPPSTPPATS